MIIVEGLDNTGKTTLINTITNLFPFLKVGRMDNAPHCTQEEYREYLWGVLGKSHHQRDFQIYDRFLFTELIYGPPLRGGAKITPVESTAALRMLSYEHPLIIYCRRTPEQILSTWDERPQLNGVKECIKVMAGQYDLMLRSKSFSPFVIEYDWEHPKAMIHVMHRLVEHIQGRFGYVEH